MPRTRQRSVGVETCVATLAAAAACAGVWLIDHGTDVTAPPQPAAEAAFGSEPSAPPRNASRKGAASPRDSDGSAGSGGGREEPSRSTDDGKVAAPSRVSIPTIGVSAPLTRLDLTADGALEAPPPDDDNLAGWYADGVPPGAVGTALVAGHVDTAAGPAVFYGLGVLGKGDQVEVVRTDGSTAVFTVDAVEVYEGDDFPDRKVYGPSDRPELRLITCGGRFDEQADEYTGNVVVFAHLTEVRPAS
ncbi:class F sortase [Streptomyces sp. TR06-5]|uniref:class F sortase n=1 Tax=unclassified Streptomyces TaxID=2593676 RepID=UPI00399F00B8